MVPSVSPESCGFESAVPRGLSVSETPSNEAEFFPRGAVAFFIVMVAFFSLVWLFFYVLTIRRH